MAISSDPHPLAIRFRQEDLRRLLQRLVTRLRRGQPLSGRIQLADPSGAERRAVAALLGGKVGSGRSLSIDLDDLAAIAVAVGEFASLQQLVEAAVGEPVVNQLAERVAVHAVWAKLWSQTVDRCGESIPLRQWLADLKTSGWIRRRSRGDAARAEQLFNDVFAVLDRLPTEPPKTLAQFAAELFGDSHALDPDTDLGRLAARAAATLAGCARPRTTTEVRAAWSNVGIVLDELSATVLLLNVPGLPGSPLGDVLSLHRGTGEPCRLTFRQLKAACDCRFDRSSGTTVHVCENPSVVAAAADRLGTGCRPLVSVEGQPNLAAEVLLRTLHQQGFTLRYHGDFDWGGLRIANRIWKLFRFEPWRYTVSDYLEAPPGRPLKGSPTDAYWDSELTCTMRAAGTGVHEEAVLNSLLADLSAIGTQ